MFAFFKDKEKCGFHSCCGKNISLANRKMTAERSQGFSHALVFSAKSMEDDEIFEVRYFGSVLLNVNSFIRVSVIRQI